MVEEKKIKKSNRRGFLKKAGLVNAATIGAQYLSGKEKLLGFFVGQAMKKSKGKANPKILNEILKERLSKKN